MNNFPPGVLDSIRSKEAVLFVGAGFSRSAGFPSSESIATFLSNKLTSDGRPVDGAKRERLDIISELYQGYYGRSRLVTDVESFLKTSPRDPLSPSHRLLASLVKHQFVRTIITTNYDTLIEDACSALGATLRVVAHKSQMHGAAGAQPVLYKIHGDFSHPELLVLTPTDFQRWSSVGAAERSIINRVQTLFVGSPLLFLGCSLSDYNILSL
jgi:NAD-dependent SIR2 family protein deacetylase